MMDSVVGKKQIQRFWMRMGTPCASLVTVARWNVPRRRPPITAAARGISRLSVSASASLGKNRAGARDAATRIRQTTSRAVRGKLPVSQRLASRWETVRRRLPVARLKPQAMQTTASAAIGSPHSGQGGPAGGGERGGSARKSAVGGSVSRARSGCGRAAGGAKTASDGPASARW